MTLPDVDQQSWQDFSADRWFKQTSDRINSISDMPTTPGLGFLNSSSGMINSLAGLDHDPAAAADSDPTPPADPATCTRAHRSRRCRSLRHPRHQCRRRSRARRLSLHRSRKVFHRSLPRSGCLRRLCRSLPGSLRRRRLPHRRDCPRR